MKVVPFEAIVPSAWDAAVVASDDAWLFHRHAWIEIEARHFGRENRSFAVVEPDGEPVALVPLYRITSSDGVRQEQVLTTALVRHTGVALRSDLAEGRRAGVTSVVFGRIFELARALDVDRIHCGVQSLAPAYRNGIPSLPSWIVEHGFHLGLAMWPSGMTAVPGLATCAVDQIVDLAADEETLFARLNEGCRRAIRKAVKAGLTCKEESASDVPAAFYDLARKSAERTGETLAPFAYYQDIVAQFGATGEAALLMVRRAGAPAAALLLLIYKGAAHFLTGVSAPEALADRPNDLAHWTAIRWAKAKGLQHYRLGPIFPSVPRGWPAAKVSWFKGKFGARSVPMLEASLFRRPAAYLAAAQRLVALHCADAEETVNARVATDRIVRPLWLTRRLGLALVAREGRYR